MECRCYHGGQGRTRKKQLHMGRIDVWALVVYGLLLGGIITLNVVMPKVL